MKYRALTNFSGVISMSEGDIREIKNETLASKLIKANFIETYTDNETISIEEKNIKKNTKNKKTK